MSEKSILTVQLEGSLLSLFMLLLCLPQTYYSSHCNINIHLLLYPPYYTGSQLRMESMVYTFCDTNSKPRASIWQKNISSKATKTVYHLTPHKTLVVFYNLGKLDVPSCSDCLIYAGDQACMESRCMDCPLHHTWPFKDKEKRSTIGHQDHRCTMVLCFSKVVRILNGFRATF